MGRRKPKTPRDKWRWVVGIVSRCRQDEPAHTRRMTLSEVFSVGRLLGLRKYVDVRVAGHDDAQHLSRVDRHGRTHVLHGRGLPMSVSDVGPVGGRFNFPVRGYIIYPFTGLGGFDVALPPPVTPSADTWGGPASRSDRGLEYLRDVDVRIVNGLGNPTLMAALTNASALWGFSAGGRLMAYRRFLYGGFERRLTVYRVAATSKTTGRELDLGRIPDAVDYETYNIKLVAECGVSDDDLLDAVDHYPPMVVWDMCEERGLFGPVSKRENGFLC